MVTRRPVTCSGSPSSGDRAGADFEQPHFLERLALLPPIEEIRPGRPLALDSILQVRFPYQRQAIGVRKRQRTQQHRIHHAEDRGVRPNAQRQHQHRHEGETRHPAQGARGVTEIFQEGEHLSVVEHATAHFGKRGKRRERLIGVSGCGTTRPFLLRNLWLAWDRPGGLSYCAWRASIGRIASVTKTMKTEAIGMISKAVFNWDASLPATAPMMRELTARPIQPQRNYHAHGGRGHLGEGVADHGQRGGKDRAPWRGPRRKPVCRRGTGRVSAAWRRW